MRYLWYSFLFPTIWFSFFFLTPHPCLTFNWTETRMVTGVNRCKWQSPEGRGQRATGRVQSAEGTHTHSLIASSWNNVISFCTVVGNRSHYQGQDSGCNPAEWGIADVALAFPLLFFFFLRRVHGNFQISLPVRCLGASLPVCFVAKRYLPKSGLLETVLFCVFIEILVAKQVFD